MPTAGYVKDVIGNSALLDGLRTASEQERMTREENLKKLLQGQAEAHDITKAKLENQLKEEALVKQRTNTEEMAGKFKNRPVHYGGVQIGGLASNPMQQVGETRRQQAQDDDKLKSFGMRMDKAGVPQTQSALAALESASRSVDDKGNETGGMVTNPNYKAKFGGGLLNVLPSRFMGAYEKVGLAPQGAQEELQLASRLMNMDTKAFSGTAVSKHEEGRKLVERGMGIGGNPQDITRGVQIMAEAAEESKNNIVSSTPPDVVDRYKSQKGKVTLQDYFGGVTKNKVAKTQPGMSDASAGEKDPDIQSYASKYGMSYEAAKKHIESHR